MNEDKLDTITNSSVNSSSPEKLNPLLTKLTTNDEPIPSDPTQNDNLIKEFVNNMCSLISQNPYEV